MYENEVHEDIIGEIEAYIKKLTTRKLARKNAVTEGLIPKYEAILKVAKGIYKGIRGFSGAACRYNQRPYVGGE